MKSNGEKLLTRTLGKNVQGALSHSAAMNAGVLVELATHLQAYTGAPSVRIAARTVRDLLESLNRIYCDFPLLFDADNRLRRGVRICAKGAYLTDLDSVLDCDDRVCIAVLSFPEPKGKSPPWK